MTSLTDRIAKSYDDFPYISGAHPQTAPEHLHAVAHLFGLTTTPPQGARVLELGCAAGGNLIPFAVRNPAAMVVGVDVSAVQIELGQRAIEAMGLGNLTLKHGSIEDLAASLGEFDYVICHGVYSWVPADVREAILRAVSRHLGPDGVAYISYNTYPGWKAKEVLRDAMLLRAEEGGTPTERLGYARGMIDFLHDKARPDSVLKKIVDANLESIRHQDECYITHEFLAPVNNPCYFGDFLSAAGCHGLSYLAESQIARMFAINCGLRAAKLLTQERAGDQVRLEQFMDFLADRAFRETLLVHSERSEHISYEFDARRLGKLHLAGLYLPAPEHVGQWQERRGGATITTNDDTRQVIEALNEAWPATVAVVDLIDNAASSAGKNRNEVEGLVLDFVRSLVTRSVVQIRLEPVVATSSASDYPEAPAALRRLVALRAESELPVTLFNAWHEPFVDLGLVEQTLLPLLDGSRDFAALVGIVRTSAEGGDIQFLREGKLLADSAEVAEAIDENTRRALRWLTENGMLAMTGASTHTDQ